MCSQPMIHEGCKLNRQTHTQQSEKHTDSACMIKSRRKNAIKHRLKWRLKERDDNRKKKNEDRSMKKTIPKATTCLLVIFTIITKIWQHWKLLLFLIMSTFQTPQPPSLVLSQSTDGYLIISDHGLMKQKILLRWNLFWGSNQHFTNYTHPLSPNECSLTSSTGFNLAGLQAAWLAGFLLQWN